MITIKQYRERMEKRRESLNLSFEIVENLGLLNYLYENQQQHH